MADRDASQNALNSKAHLAIQGSGVERLTTCAEHRARDVYQFVLETGRFVLRQGDVHARRRHIGGIVEAIQQETQIESNVRPRGDAVYSRKRAICRRSGAAHLTLDPAIWTRRLAHRAKGRVADLARGKAEAHVRGRRAHGKGFTGQEAAFAATVRSLDKDIHTTGTGFTIIGCIARAGAPAIGENALVLFLAQPEARAHLQLKPVGACNKLAVNPGVIVVLATTGRFWACAHTYSAPGTTTAGAGAGAVVIVGAVAVAGAGVVRVRVAAVVSDVAWSTRQKTQTIHVLSSWRARRSSDTWAADVPGFVCHSRAVAAAL